MRSQKPAGHVVGWLVCAGNRPRVAETGRAISKTGHTGPGPSGLAETGSTWTGKRDAQGLMPLGVSSYRLRLRLTGAWKNSASIIPATRNRRIQSAPVEAKTVGSERATQIRYPLLTIVAALGQGQRALGFGRCLDGGSDLVVDEGHCLDLGGPRHQLADPVEHLLLSEQ